MTRVEIEALVAANASALGLKIAAEHKTGVVAFFAIAAEMARLIDDHPFAIADESGSVFVPVAAQGSS